MATELSFEISGVPMRLVFKAAGVQELSSKGVLLSKVSGDKPHAFKHQGDEYEVSARSDRPRATLRVKKNGAYRETGLSGGLGARPEFLCGWPLLLGMVLAALAFQVRAAPVGGDYRIVGSVLGLALGGVAAGVNLVIYRSDLERPAKVVLNVVCGGAAVLLWVLITRAI